VRLVDEEFSEQMELVLGTEDRKERRRPRTPGVPQAESERGNEAGRFRTFAGVRLVRRVFLHLLVHHWDEGADPARPDGRGLGGRAPRIAIYYADCMAQLVTRVEDDLVAAVDELVAAGVVASRSEAVRLGLVRLVERCRRERIAAEIVEGYRRRPQTDGEVGWADDATRRMIADEPW